jgi:hypothetical protein
MWGRKGLYAQLSDKSSDVFIESLVCYTISSSGTGGFSRKTQLHGVSYIIGVSILLVVCA